MVDSNKPESRHQGPKRSETSRHAILEATREELYHNGWRNFSAERLAKNAKASKQTIYRWWPSVAVLAVESALDVLPGSRQNVEGFEAQITALVEPICAMVRRGDFIHIFRSAIIAASDDVQASKVLNSWVNESIRQPLRLILAEAAIKSKIRRDWDIDIAIDVLLGPIWHRMVVMRRPLPEDYAKKLSDGLLRLLRV